MERITLYIYIFLLSICNISSIPPESNRRNNQHLEESQGDGQKHQEQPQIIDTQKQDHAETKAADNNKPVNKNNNLIKGNVHDDKNKSVSANNLTTPKVLVDNANIKTSGNAEIESGAVMRGIFVFVGITMICIMYIGFKTYFRRGNKKNPLIKKYGVKTRRSDIEMEPLPLEEDEDDETVFDLGHVTNR